MVELSPNRKWLLARRPHGLPCVEDFRWEEAPAPDLGEGEFLVRNLCLSCDPTQLGWMAGNTYFPAVKIGEVMRSFALGAVVSSRDPRVPEGRLLQGLFGWQDYCVVRPDDERYILPAPPNSSIEAALSILGFTGLTAYFGLLDIGRPSAGNTVVVSGAAGATGSAVAQIAKIHGCRVVGIAGGPSKCRFLVEELGVDAAIDYKSENVATRLRQTCPQGIHVFFDNVGGRILDAALMHLARGARIVLCGAIASYTGDAIDGPRNYLQLLLQRAVMQGFLVLDYLPRAAEAIEALQRWVSEGKLKDRVDVQFGLENAPRVLARVFRGENQGKQLLSIASS
jgi:NADPH-dependent curcumin reductase CurA